MGVLAASALGMAGLGAPLRSAIPFTVNPAPGDEVPAPVRFQAPRVDLALTLKGAVREAALTLVNTSSEAIGIASITSDCPCVSISGTEGDSLVGAVLAPGDSRTIRIRYTAPLRAGRASRSMVTVRLADGRTVKTAVTSRVVEAVASAHQRVAAPVERDTMVELVSMDGSPFRVTASEPAVFGALPLEPSTGATLTLTRDLWLSAGRPRAVLLTIEHPVVKHMVVRLAEPPPDDPESRPQTPSRRDPRRPSEGEMR